MFKNRRRKKLLEIVNNFSLSERFAYHELTRFELIEAMNILMIPIKITFYLLVFAACFKYAFEIDIVKEIMFIPAVLVKHWWIFLVISILAIIVDSIKVRRIHNYVLEKGGFKNHKIQRKGKIQTNKRKTAKKKSK